MHRKTLASWLAPLAACVLALPFAAAQQPPAPPAPKPFGNPHVWKWAPSRTYHVENYRLQLRFNQPKGEVFGDEVVTLRPFASGFREFYLNSVELTIDSVSLLRAGANPVPLDFAPRDPKLWITLDRTYTSADTLRVRIVYHGFPRTGLYFVNPNPAYPDWPREVWSQGESEFNRYWFPCWDYPNDKATSETITTVPAGQSVVSNGVLKSVTHGAGPNGPTSTYDWVEAVPHSSYLIAIAVGPWKEIQQSWDGIPVDYYVPNYVSRAEALRSFGLTPDMIGFDSHLFGVRYPYNKYAQTTVHNFTEGGMENISATTQTEWTLHSARANADYPSTELVSHELAHQWFGDLVTTRDWADIWLNEGFATFLEGLYTQHHSGNDAYRLEMSRDQHAGRMEDRYQYERPIVDHHYLYSMQMFDGTTYEKGAAVLDMLRWVMDLNGHVAPLDAQSASPPEPLFQALHAYLLAHHAQNAGTHDLMQAIRQATGQNMDGFFHQWIFRAGYPQYRVHASYDGANHVESVQIQQTQKASVLVPIFAMPVQLAFYGAHGAHAGVIVWDRLQSQDFNIPLGFRPLWVDFDPNDHIDKTLSFRQPVNAWIAAAESDPAPMARLWAVRQLGNQGGAYGNAVVAALAQVLTHDAFNGARQAAAVALGKLASPTAQSALLAALPAETNSHVRAAVAGALSHFPRQQTVYQALVNELHSDQSYAAEAAAAVSLGQLHMPGAFAVLAATVRSQPEIHVLQGALVGLTETHNPAAAPILLAAAKNGQPERERLVALDLLPRLKAAIGGKPAWQSQLAGLVRETEHDPFPFVVSEGEQLIGAYRLTQFEPFLQARAAGAATPTGRRAARRILAQMQAPPKAAASAARLDQLEGQIRKLQAQVHALEQRPAPPQP